MTTDPQSASPQPSAQPAEVHASLGEHRVLGRTGVRVSQLTLGTMNYGQGQPSGEDEGIRLIQQAIEAGVTVIDTAESYGNGSSEIAVGKALAGRRDDVFLATKFHPTSSPSERLRGNSRYRIVKSVEDSLRRLNTDRIDLYQVHRPDPETDVRELVWTLNDLIRQGKILYYGTSVFPAESLVEAQHFALSNGLIPPATEQLPYSLLIRTAERHSFPVARRYGVGTLTYGPLAAGWLSGRYRLGGPQPESHRAHVIPGRFDIEAAANRRKLQAADALAALAEEAGLSLPQLALGFALNHPAVSSVIIGPRTQDHLDAYLHATQVRLDDDLLDRIDEIVAPGTHFIERDTGTIPAALTPAQLRR